MGFSVKNTYISSGTQQIAMPLIMDQATNNNGLTLSKSGTGTGQLVSLDNYGTSYALGIVQRGAAPALSINGINTSANNNGTVFIQGATTKRCMYLSPTGVLDSGHQIFLINDVTAQTTGESELSINNTNASTTIPMIKLANSGTGADIKIIGRATGGISLSAEGEIAYDTTLHALVYHNGTTTKVIATV